MFFLKKGEMSGGGNISNSTPLTLWKTREITGQVFCLVKVLINVEENGRLYN